MIRWCAYCQRFLGEVEPWDSLVVTHGLCDACVDRRALASEESVARIAPISDFFEQLHAHGVAGRPIPVRETVERARRLGVRPADLLMGMIQPILICIGDDGRRPGQGQNGDKDDGQNGAADNALPDLATEHVFASFADAVSHLVLEEYGLATHHLAADHLDILLLCPEGNHHYLGVRFLEVLLRQEGFSCRAVYPGVDTLGAGSLVHAFRPRLVGVSVALPGQVWTARELRRHLAERPPADGVPPVLLGGVGTQGREDALREEGFLVPGGDLDALVELVRRVTAPADAS